MSSETPEQLREYLERLPEWVAVKSEQDHETVVAGLILLGRCVQLLSERGCYVRPYVNETGFGVWHTAYSTVMGTGETPLAAAVAALAGMGEKA